MMIPMVMLMLLQLLLRTQMVMLMRRILAL